VRILVTASRKLKPKDLPLLRQALIDVTAGSPGPHTLVNGGAPGGDTMFAIAAAGLGWTVETHEADWGGPCRDTCKPGHRRSGRNGRGDYCPAAGDYRNQVMVDLGADACVAGLKHGARNAGTRDCMRRAAAAGLNPREVWA
jgi:hypothetical protein